MIGNALFFRETGRNVRGRIYRKAYWATVGLGSPPSRVQMGWFDRTLNCCLGFLSLPVRLILVKDVACSAAIRCNGPSS